MIAVGPEAIVEHGGVEAALGKPTGVAGALVVGKVGVASARQDEHAGAMGPAGMSGEWCEVRLMKAVGAEGAGCGIGPDGKRRHGGIGNHARPGRVRSGFFVGGGDLSGSGEGGDLFFQFAHALNEVGKFLDGDPLALGLFVRGGGYAEHGFLFADIAHDA